ncbi:MAG: hypothetical protein ACLVG5_16985 [Clostridium sp.]
MNLPLIWISAISDILNSIRKLARERNIAVIMSLHELDLVQKVSDMVACVDGTTVSH